MSSQSVRPIRSKYDRKRNQFPEKKRKRADKCCSFSNLDGISVASSCGVALAAVYRLPVSGIERNLAGFSALSADSVEHFSTALSRVLLRITARLASLGLVLKALLCIEFLLTGCEHELIPAILASQSLVLVHVVSFLAFNRFCFALRRIPTDAFASNALP